MLHVAFALMFYSKKIIGMKIKSLSLNNYKKFRRTGQPFNFDFFDHETGIVNEVTLITGNNGEGKTSVLQAIAAVVGAAVRDKFGPQDLEWPGFNYAYIQNENLPVRIVVDLVFEQEEVNSIREFCKELQSLKTDSMLRVPPNRLNVSLYLNKDSNKVFATTDSGMDAYFLTKGYQYAKQLESIDRNYGLRFERVGSIYWYDEQRTSASITKYLYSEFKDEKITDQLGAIKQLVANWYYAHLDIQMGRFKLREGQFDKFDKLKNLYEKVFVGRTIERATLQKGGGNGIDVIFNDGENDYDLTEMSAGERAIFPLLLDFANLSINNSIILIDEIELHLHPPLQQQFLDALPNLGNNNQFIITTHSPFIASQFSDDNKIVVSNESNSLLIL